MKTSLGLLITGILTLIFGWVFPWWFIVFAGFLSAWFFAESSFAAIVIGFLGSFFTLILISGLIDYQNEGLLSEQMGELFNLDSSLLLIIISGLIGGIVCGLGALIAYFGKKLLQKEVA